MPSIAGIADPSSYSQARRTFGTGARTTRGAACGRAGLNSFDIARSVPAGFVAKLQPKLRPRCVDRGFSLRSIGQRFGSNVPDYNQSIFARQFRGQDVQVVPTHVGDFRVNRLYPSLFAGSLRIGEQCLVLFEMTRIVNLASIRQRGQCHQAEIDANFPGSAGPDFGNLDTEAEVPASTRVFCEAAGFDSAADMTTAPEPITAIDVNHRVADQRDRARGRKRNPTQAPFPAPTRTARRDVAVNDKLLADGLNSVAMQTKQYAASGCQLDEVEGAGPWPLVSSRRLLRLAAEIPDAIHRPSMSAEVLRSRCVLDAVSVGENHEVRVSCALMPSRSRSVRNARKHRGASSVNSLRRRQMGNAPYRCNVRIYRCVGEQ
jgi:hypothetical protein